MLAGCSAAENIGNSAQATTITPPPSNHYVQATAPSPRNDREPSCTWSPGTRFNGGAPVWVCGFVDDNPDPVWSANGWSWSTDGITWTYCNANAGGACGITPVPAGMSFSQGDPVLVADGEGNVVYVGIGKQTDGNNIIWAAMSTDSGKTFPNAIQVNESGSACSPATEDQPSADFDLTTPSTAARKISVVWRHNGSGTFGGCMRRGTFCASVNSDPACGGLPGGTAFPTIAWDTPNGLDIGGMDRQDQVYGQSGLIVQAGDGAVAVAAANCDGSMVSCPNTSLQNCGWERVLTYDGGQHWTDNVHFDDTTTLQTCVVNGGSPPNGGRLEERHRGTFAFVRNRRNGDYYAATMHSKGEIHLFRSENQGATWTNFVNIVNANAPTLALPVLASDTAGRLALEYTESDSSDINVHAVFATNVFDPTPADPDPAPLSSNWAFDVLTSFYNPSPDNGVRDIGDYNGIGVADPVVDGTCTATSTFLPAWTDTLDPFSPLFMVNTAVMSVSP